MRGCGTSFASLSVIQKDVPIYGEWVGRVILLDAFGSCSVQSDGQSVRFRLKRSHFVFKVAKFGQRAEIEYASATVDQNSFLT
jgi:hypothetical protein